jgi:pimeloyl-ACP methyl ester carboxylesterase
MAEDTAALLHALGIERADFVGYSMGGAVRAAEREAFRNAVGEPFRAPDHGSTPVTTKTSTASAAASTTATAR